MPCCLTHFSRIRPRNELDQEYILDWIARMHAHAAVVESGVAFEEFYSEIKQKIDKIGLGKERIEKRGTLIDDLLLENLDDAEVYPIRKSPKGKGFAERSAFFDREAFAIFQQFYPEGRSLPSHLIHVTCTGYVSPSPAQKLISLRDAGRTTTVTHAYHMGCYGAFPAIRIASGFLSLPSPSPKTDIVHTELCSLHMHPLRHSNEQLLVQSLFGDGFIKYSVLPNCDAPHLRVQALLEETIADSSHSMTWRCEDEGLGMTLTKDVPLLISRALEGYLERLCSQIGWSVEMAKNEALFAVHPGGPKILQHVEGMLRLSPWQMQHSKDVLRSFGNMSSATLPHIWENILLDPAVPRGTKIISLAFGPGLCISGGLFAKG